MIYLFIEAFFKIINKQDPVYTKAPIYHHSKERNYYIYMQIPLL